jgi:hypothetical protein
VEDDTPHNPVVILLGKRSPRQIVDFPMGFSKGQDVQLASTSRNIDHIMASIIGVSARQFGHAVLRIGGQMEEIFLRKMQSFDRHESEKASPGQGLHTDMNYNSIQILLINDLSNL